MQVDVQGGACPTPFLQAQDIFTTEFDLDRPVKVFVQDDPDQRTFAAHPDDHHVLTMSQSAATSRMAAELALHEYAHMYHHEHHHPSHTQSTEEVLFLALTGHDVEKRKLSHCYQIANHMKDIYADDLTLAVGPSRKLVTYLESALASAIVDRPRRPPVGGRRRTARLNRRSRTADPEITAVNAAFALALVERNQVANRDNRLYDLAHAATTDAPEISFETFKDTFRSLSPDPTEAEYRRTLVDLTREYAIDKGTDEH